MGKKLHLRAELLIDPKDVKPDDFDRLMHDYTSLYAYAERALKKREKYWEDLLRAPFMLPAEYKAFKKKWGKDV